MHHFINKLKLFKRLLKVGKFPTKLNESYQSYHFLENGVIFKWKIKNFISISNKTKQSKLILWHQRWNFKTICISIKHFAIKENEKNE